MNKFSSRIVASSYRKHQVLLVVWVLVIFTFLALDTKPVTIFLVGDSTMADKPIEGNPERGWGMVLPSYFNSNIKIENHARNGRSSRTFAKEGRWAFLMNRISTGDYVVIQFGHNDEVETKTSYTTPADFKANFERMVKDVRSKNAYPILCTSVARRSFDSLTNALVDTHPVYPNIIREVAKNMNVPLIDMQRRSEDVLRTYGPEKSKSLFLHIQPGVWKAMPQGRTDNTHFSELGAMEMAKCFADGIKKVRIKPLKRQLLKDNQVKLKLTEQIAGIDQIKPTN